MEARGELSTDRPVVNTEVPGVGDDLHSAVGTARPKQTKALPRIQTVSRRTCLKDMLRRLGCQASGN